MKTLTIWMRIALAFAGEERDRRSLILIEVVGGSWPTASLHAARAKPAVLFKLGAVWLDDVVAKGG